MRLRHSKVLLLSILLSASASVADTWTDQKTGRTWTYRTIGDTVGLKDFHGKSMPSKMVAYWVKRHPEEVKRFREAFMTAYNFVALKHGMELMRF